MAEQSSSRNILEAEGLTKVFGAGPTEVLALDGVDLSVRAGELVLIMGPSGSGKTTLLSMIGGLLRPTAGQIRIGGLDITDVSDREMSRIRREMVGFVFQSFNLLDALTVEENVEIVLNLNGVKGQEARTRAVALLEERGLEHRLGFSTRGLSGGEKQRVSIARALANEPRLVLADEPTANLDARHGHDVMRLLRQISRAEGRAVIVASHDHRLREVADRVLWLEDGRFVEMGRMAEDPVCQMSVDVDQAVSLTHEGTTYYFCAQGCAREFQESPDRFS